MPYAFAVSCVFFACPMCWFEVGPCTPFFAVVQPPHSVSVVLLCLMLTCLPVARSAFSFLTV